ncbi:fasciclin domain-containing protein [Aureitalea marina]|uniref:FAS1 domain-containing protein n=1 Tax=Aureitalea marina TaxID=930804 RepID=A0A2S7KMB0_9FLAO|nr:fasciclin domain-containing protein [Aureitalea marina]PQB03766.1 hypothetical protein BST85_01745 [Aureitalea marina]
MNKYLVLSLVVLLFTACKNEVKEGSSDSDKTDTITDASPMNTEVRRVIPVKKELSELEKNQVNSLMTKIMLNTELRTFSSITVSAQMTDMLASEEGPFTVFVPESLAFNQVPQETINELVNPSNKEGLVNFLNGYIVDGLYDAESITAQLAEKGSLSLESRAGTTLTLNQTTSGIQIEDSDGNKARVVQADIVGFNGVVHSLDAVLGLN